MPRRESAPTNIWQDRRSVQRVSDVIQLYVTLQSGRYALNTVGPADATFTETAGRRALDDAAPAGLRLLARSHIWMQ